jgi:hypothetical protein
MVRIGRLDEIMSEHLTLKQPRAIEYVGDRISENNKNGNSRNT